MKTFRTSEKAKTSPKSRPHSSKRSAERTSKSSDDSATARVRHTIKKRHRQGEKAVVSDEGTANQRADTHTVPTSPATPNEVLNSLGKARKSGEAKTLKSKEAMNAGPNAAADRTSRKRKASAAIKSQRKRREGLSKKERAQKAKRGVIYIGHLPLGFLEPQLKAFFSQFGEVCRVRLFRSRKNAHSKGYAFIEFALREVAEVAAQTMDKYRMFGRTLVCRLTEKGQVQEHVFRKCHKPFKRINWQARAAAQHNKPEGQLPSAKGISAVRKRMKKKAELLQKLGIDLELPLLHKPSGEAGHLPECVKHECQEKQKTKKALLDSKRKAPAAASATA